MMLALQRSLASLGSGKVWLYILGPALAAVLFMIGVSAAFLNYFVITSYSIHYTKLYEALGVL